MAYYPRYQQAVQQFYDTHNKEYDDPVKQAKYNSEREDLFEKMISGIIGSGTNEGASIERALAFQEGGGLAQGDVGSEFTAAFGGSRKLGDKERMVPGAYTLAKFPGMEHQLFALRTGAPPKGYRVDPRESMGDFNERKALQRQFANTQEDLLGMRGVDDNPLYKQFANRRATRRVGRGR